MTRILLIRHGSTDLLGRVLYGRMPGVHLNAEGLRQAQSVAYALKQEYEMEAIISSPLERALETAGPIAQAYGKSPIVKQGIVEIDFGEWVGVSFADLKESDSWREFNRRRSLHAPPGGETMVNVQARTWSSIKEAVEEYAPGSTLAMVTHGDVVRCALALILGSSVDHINRFEIAPGSVTEILAGDHDPFIKSVNRIFY